MTTKTSRQRPIVAVYWHEAAYTHEIEFPRGDIPVEHVTFGVMLQEDPDQIIVGMNCHGTHRGKEITHCRDAFAIPKKTIQRIDQLGHI